MCFGRGFRNGLQAALSHAKLFADTRQVISEKPQTILKDDLFASKFLQPSLAQLVEIRSLSAHLSRLHIAHLPQFFLLPLPSVREIRLHLSDARVEFLAVAPQLGHLRFTLPSKFLLLLQSILLEQTTSFRQLGFGLTTPLQQVFAFANSLHRHLVFEPLLSNVLNFFRTSQRGPFFLALSPPGGFASGQFLFKRRSLPSQILEERLALLGQRFRDSLLMLNALLNGDSIRFLQPLLMARLIGDNRLGQQRLFGLAGLVDFESRLVRPDADSLGDGLWPSDRRSRTDFGNPAVKKIALQLGALTEPGVMN